MKRIRILMTVVACLFVLTVGLGVTAYALNGAQKDTICDGVYVNGIALGGMTTEQAEQTLKEYVNRLKDTSVFLSVDGRGVEETSLRVLGLDADDHSYIAEAAAVGKTGNLIQRYKEIKDVEAEPMEYQIQFSMREDSVRAYVASLSERYDIAAVNATMTRQNGQFAVTPHIDGRKINIEESVRLIRSAVLEQWNLQGEIQLDLVVEDDKAQYTEDDLKKVDTVLGSYTTDYSTSASGRKKNVENGTRLLNGIVLYPGEELSVYSSVSPFTVENGYGVGGAYLNGEVVDSIGGGICQVSTTLYNAVLYSELEVTERSAHSMIVTYVPLSRDAAIAGDYKDFKFRNNQEIPVYIEGYTRNGKVTFNIYGCETRDMSSHKVDFEYEIVETKEPGKDVVTEDPTKPASYEKVTQSAHTGYTTHLYKLTYENGKLIEKKRINTSYYRSAPRYVIKGTGPEVEDEKPKDDKEDKEESVNTDETEDIGSDEIIDLTPDASEEGESEEQESDDFSEDE